MLAAVLQGEEVLVWHRGQFAHLTPEALASALPAAEREAMTKGAR